QVNELGPLVMRVIHILHEALGEKRFQAGTDMLPRHGPGPSHLRHRLGPSKLNALENAPFPGGQLPSPVQLCYHDLHAMVQGGGLVDQLLNWTIELHVTTTLTI